MEEPPRDPDDWTEDQWIEWLEATADAPSSDDPELTPRRWGTGNGAGAVIGAAMMGLDRALHGEQPKPDVVIESHSDDPDRDASRFDPEDPGSSTIRLTDTDTDPPT